MVSRFKVPSQKKSVPDVFGVSSRAFRTKSGNIVFTGQLDGTFAAYDAKTLQEVWSFNVGSGINAPAITYAVNGKQYVAVLVGSRLRDNLLAEAPELKNVAVTHMLYVFGL